jgi:hypothetical protein
MSMSIGAEETLQGQEEEEEGEGEEVEPMDVAQPVDCEPAEFIDLDASTADRHRIADPQPPVELARTAPVDLARMAPTSSKNTGQEGFNPDLLINEVIQALPQLGNSLF